MLRTIVEKDFRVRLPKEIQNTLQIGEELFVALDKAGRIFLIPQSRVEEILGQTAGMWRGRTDVPVDGAAYVNQLRTGRRLQELGVIHEESGRNFGRDASR